MCCLLATTRSLREWDSRQLHFNREKSYSRTIQSSGYHRAYWHLFINHGDEDRDGRARITAAITCPTVLSHLARLTWLHTSPSPFGLVSFGLHLTRRPQVNSSLSISPFWSQILPMCSIPSVAIESVCVYLLLSCSIIIHRWLYVSIPSALLNHDPNGCQRV